MARHGRRQALPPSAPNPPAKGAPIIEKTRRAAVFGILVSLLLIVLNQNTAAGKEWTLRKELRRPWAVEGFESSRPLNTNFYGYPTIAPINEDEYLVVFTERSRTEGHKQADLYYLRLIFD